MAQAQYTAILIEEGGIETIVVSSISGGKWYSSLEPEVGDGTSRALDINLESLHTGVVANEPSTRPPVWQTIILASGLVIVEVGEDPTKTILIGTRARIEVGSITRDGDMIDEIDGGG